MRVRGGVGYETLRRLGPSAAPRSAESSKQFLPPCGAPSTVRSVKSAAQHVVDVVRQYENKLPQARSPPNQDSITMTDQPPVPPIDQTKAGVLWNKVRDHVVSDDNFAETPRPVNDDEDDEKNLKPPSLVYPPDGCIPVLHPDGDVRFYWDLAQMVSLIWVSIFVPLRIGFDWPAVGMWFIIDSVIDLYFIFDFVLGFFTAVHLHEDTRVDDDASGDYFEFGGHYVVVDKKRIALSYLRGWFAIDFFASLPIEFFMRLEQGSLGCSFRVVNPCSVKTYSTGATIKLVKILRLFRILKLFRLLKLKKLFNRYQDDFVYLCPSSRRPS